MEIGFGMDLAFHVRVKYRVFDDYLGRRWEVWQTNPIFAELRFVERRQVPDRRSGLRADTPERRTEDQRRARASTPFPGIPQLAAGWLCFESEGERRRLAPVPDQWESADDMTLAALCNFASEEIKRW